MKNNTLFILSFLVLFSFISCHKDSDTLVATTTVTQDQHFVASNYNGVITDIDGIAIENALVKIGDQSALTDQNGFFYLSAVVSQKGAALKITKDGFFNGLANLALNQAKDNFIRMALQEKRLNASFESSEAREINFRDHQLRLEADSYITESGSSYTGIVEVYLAYIDPTASSFSDLMPGDLLSDSETQAIEILKSYGMMHVELTTPQGLALQINKPASLTLTIPAPLIQDAPALVPLWYFNEDTGLWIEEGQAQKEGDKYVGTVNHFTLWNIDHPRAGITLKGKINSRSTLKNIRVQVTSEVLNQTLTTYTNYYGEFSGLVPTDDNILIEVLNNCDEVKYSETIQTFSEDVYHEFYLDLNNIELITLNGYITDCNGGPVSNGYVIVDNGNPVRNTVYQCDQDGYIESDFYKCSDNDLIVIVVDLDNGLQSTASFPVVSNTLDIGNLEACDDQIINKLTYEANGTIENIYGVLYEPVFGGDHSFEYTVGFPDGSSYKASHKLELDQSIWVMKNEYSNIIGSPSFVLAFDINTEVEFLAETSTDFEVEFNNARIYNFIDNQTITTGGRVYINASK